jgi:outer membrane protein
MKKVFALLAVAVLASWFLTQEAFAKDLKIGCVDMQKVFTEYKKTQDAEAKLGEKGKEKTDKRNKMVEEIRRLKDELDLLSDKGKDEKQAQIDGKIKELQDFDRTTRDELLREREDVLRGISQDIEKAIADYGKRHKYDIILNKDKRVLLYEQQGLDVTSDILKALNK